MRKIHLGLAILFLASVFNYYTDFGFLLNSDALICLWLFFYAIILPIGLMYYFSNRYKTETYLYKISLYIFLFYLLSLFISGFDFFDFDNFEIRGDGATQYVVKMIFIICIVSSFTSLLFFQIKNRKPNKKTN